MSFVSVFLRILSYVGSEDPEIILKETDIDIGSKSFWREGFRMVEYIAIDIRKVV